MFLHNYIFVFAWSQHICAFNILILYKLACRKLVSICKCHVNDCSSKSEASVSEWIKKLEEMFYRYYYMRSDDIFKVYEFTTTKYGVLPVSKHHKIGSGTCKENIKWHDGLSIEWKDANFEEKKFYNFPIELWLTLL